MSSFTSPLKVEHIDGRIWKVLEPFTYWTQEGETITVIQGFQTDFASIPRLFWSIIGHPTGRYGKAAVIHDFLYFTQTTSRREADRIFLEAMAVLNVSWFKRWIMWLAVRAFSWIPWNKRKEIILDQR